MNRPLLLACLATGLLTVGCGGGNQPQPPAAVTVSPAAGAPTIAITPPAGTPILGPTRQVTNTPVPASPTPGGSATPAGTPGTPGPTPNTAGRSITADDVQQAWRARGITLANQDATGAASGFSVPPSSVRLTKGNDTINLVVFIYPSQSAAAEDWNLSASTSPKAGKNPGQSAAVWWNENVVVVLRERVGGITDDARDAILTLGGPAGAGQPAAAASPGSSPAGTASPAASPASSPSPAASGSPAASPAATTAAPPPASPTQGPPG